MVSGKAAWRFERQRVLEVLAADDAYRKAYEELFGPLPEAGSEDEAIDRAFSNVGKSIAAFERQILPTTSRFDRYAAALVDGEDGDRRALTTSELAGLRLFISERAQCTRCHNGPMFTNFGFHNLGLIEFKRGVRKYDTGRVRGIKKAVEDPFNCTGAFSDAKPEDCEEQAFVKVKGAELAGAFKVPTLRNVAETAPYMHDGRFGTLAEVLTHYKDPPLRRLGHQELNPLDLTPEETQQIIAFLGSLTGPRVDY